jgi:hypothetical protein
MWELPEAAILDSVLAEVDPRSSPGPTLYAAGGPEGPLALGTVLSSHESRQGRARKGLPVFPAYVRALG